MKKKFIPRAVAEEYFEHETEEYIAKYPLKLQWVKCYPDHMRVDVHGRERKRHEIYSMETRVDDVAKQQSLGQRTQKIKIDPLNWVGPKPETVIQRCKRDAEAHYRRVHDYEERFGGIFKTKTYEQMLDELVIERALEEKSVVDDLEWRMRAVNIVSMAENCYRRNLEFEVKSNENKIEKDSWLLRQMLADHKRKVWEERNLVNENERDLRRAIKGEYRRFMADLGSLFEIVTKASAK